MAVLLGVENFEQCEAAEILENDHYGLEKVKERIVEQLALLMHNPDGKSRFSGFPPYCGAPVS